MNLNNIIAFFNINNFFSNMNVQSFDVKFILLVVFGTCFVLYLIIWLIQYIIHRIQIRNLEIAMVRFPNYADVRYRIAEAYYSYGDYENAEKYYRETINIYKFNVPAKIKLAMLLLDYRNNIEEAFAFLAQARFMDNPERRAVVIIDNYLKGKKLYEQFYAKYGSKASL
ncbi:MAG: hypothetical protein QMC67_11405 [Candidatus Wallbacteria bacterium]